MSPAIITFEFYKFLPPSWEDFKKYYQSTYNTLGGQTNFNSNTKTLYENTFRQKTLDLLKDNAALFYYKVDLTKTMKIECSHYYSDTDFVLHITMTSVQYTVIDTQLDRGVDNSTIEKLLIVEGDQSENLKKGKMYHGEIKFLHEYRVVTYKPVI